MAVHESEDKQAWGNSSGRAWKQSKISLGTTNLLSVRRSVLSRNPGHDAGNDKKKSWPRLFMYAASAASLAGNLMVLWPVLMKSARFIAMAAMINYRQGRMKLSALHEYMGNLLLSRRLLCLLIVLVLLMQSAALLSTRESPDSKYNGIAQYCTNFIKSMSDLSADERDQKVSTAAGVDLHDHVDHQYPEYPSKSSSVIKTPPAAYATISLPVEIDPSRPAVVDLEKHRSCSRLHEYEYNDGCCNYINNGCMSTGKSLTHNDIVSASRPVDQANDAKHCESALNRLSSEQFRFTIETFLLKHRKRMRAELLNDESFHHNMLGV